VQLDKSKFFIALILEDLGKHGHFMVISKICFNSGNNGASPLNDQWLEPILLIEVSVHVLLHGLDGQPALPALVIELELVLVDVGNDIFQLTEGQNFVKGCI
jgi:hypothetical protein